MIAAERTQNLIKIYLTLKLKPKSILKYPSICHRFFVSYLLI